MRGFALPEELLPLPENKWKDRETEGVEQVAFEQRLWEKIMSIDEKTCFGMILILSAHRSVRLGQILATPLYVMRPINHTPQERACSGVDAKGIFDNVVHKTVSFPLQTRCARGVNPLSPIGHSIDPKLIARGRRNMESQAGHIGAIHRQG